MATGRDDPRDRLLELVDDQLRELAGADPWAMVVGGLSAAAVEQPERQAQAHNPKPAGAILPGGTTAAVRDLLAAQPRRWWRLSSVAWQLRDRSPRTISWALHQLRVLGLIEVRPDLRTSRYLEYRHRPCLDMSRERDDGPTKAIETYEPLDGEKVLQGLVRP